jgi:excisionase family DNA binding protein
MTCINEENEMEVFLTVDDLSKMLKVSQVWLYKLVREKRIPFYHIEKCVRFSPSEIEKWLEDRRMGEYHRDKIKVVSLSCTKRASLTN